MEGRAQMGAERSDGRDAGEVVATPLLEDLIPLAAVIGAGCEPCAERMVARALAHEDAGPLVERTLAILAEVSGAKCFEGAVGPEAVVRMKRSLRAGHKALDRTRRGETTCCG
jgi:hypothetical protein